MRRTCANKKHELEGAYNLYWGKLYKLLQINERLGVQVGGMVNASLGFIYNTSNSNNPAQARAHVNVMPTAVATYRFHVQFSPNYGQSYYEIFSRGNYDHNIVPTTIVCAPEWRHMITFDAAVSKKMTLRIGYLGNMQQSKVNHIGYSSGLPAVSQSSLTPYEKNSSISSLSSRSSFLCRPSRARQYPFG